MFSLLCRFLLVILPDDFDAVSRIEVFVSDSVLIISPFLLVHFTKK